MILAAAGLHYGCLEVARPGQSGWGFHERRKASSAGSRLIVENLLWSCQRCNGAVEDHPDEVRAATGSALVLREGDGEYVALSRRAERTAFPAADGWLTVTPPA